MLNLLYCVSLLVIVAAAVVIAAHSAIPGGFVGATMLGGVAVFGLAGLDVERPHPWLVGFVASLAGSAIWAAVRWQWARTRLLRRMRDSAS